MTLNNRRQGHSVEIGSEYLDPITGETIKLGPFIATVNFDPDNGHPVEVFFAGRGKEGHQLNGLLYDMGIAMSKIMQGRLDEV